MWIALAVVVGLFVLGKGGLGGGAPHHRSGSGSGSGSGSMQPPNPYANPTQQQSGGQNWGQVAGSVGSGLGGLLRNIGGGYGDGSGSGSGQASYDGDPSSLAGGGDSTIDSSAPLDPYGDSTSSGSDESGDGYGE